MRQFTCRSWAGAGRTRSLRRPCLRCRPSGLPARWWRPLSSSARQTEGTNGILGANSYKIKSNWRNKRNIRSKFIQNKFRNKKKSKYKTSNAWRNLTIPSQGASEVKIVSHKSSGNLSDVIMKIYKIAILWKWSKETAKNLKESPFFTYKFIFMDGQIYLLF